MDLHSYAQAFEESGSHFERSLEKHGLPLEETESSPREQRFRTGESSGCHCENGGTSLWRNWISPACLACRTGKGTGSLFVDLNCTKSCYFCFNVNQPHYEHFRAHQRDIELELEQAHKAGAEYRCLAVTGGEPLLHKDRVASFFKRAVELYPNVHTRLYTNGDLVDEDALAKLAESGLAEIRFSIKPLDFDTCQERVYAAIEKAVPLIPSVVIEMPVIPGSLDDMKTLIRRADALGVRGINLLEFCFPLHNVEEFRKRGFELRKQPYQYPYDYWYGGGIPVAHSEHEALELMEFAARENLRIGVHYCSADNRNSAQINLQNSAFASDEDLQRRYPWMDFDAEDHYLKCAKVFGEDVEAVRAWADQTDGVVYGLNESVPSICFARSFAPAVRKACPAAEIGESISMLEKHDDSTVRMREVAIRKMP